ncbi:MAG: leucine--tRNA ligase [Euryarchaeota archaeon]|nr:leucine--tRNA ligase [Euryarchaeota archaeon]
MNNTSNEYNFVEVERKWQKRWEEARAFEAEPIEGKKKFFIIFAYPGISGYLHVGHMRGYTYADVIARYMRMRGYNVLFPAGFHASGLPSVGFAKKIERGDPATIAILKENGVPDDVIEKLKDPYEVVNFFRDIYIDEWKKFGFSIDFRYTLCSIDPGYQRFIQWQFRKLHEKGLLVKKQHYAPYCPRCGPVAVDPSETDISKGGNAEILDFLIIKFRDAEDKSLVYPAATLRPETIFGVTNMWVNPDVEYLVVKIDNERWILSEEGKRKLEFQLGRELEIECRIKGENLVGRRVIAPLINRAVPVYPAKFVDPLVGTGIVMSVPGHAPYDWIALKDLGMPVEPISIIKVEGFSELPAKDACEMFRVKSQEDRDGLEEATKEVYKKEYHRGVMKENCGEFAGMKVSEAKERVKEKLISIGEAINFKEFSEEVICRCGSRVYIKLVPDQWFIKYSDPELKKKTLDHMNKMVFYPKHAGDTIKAAVEWYDDRACVRKGRWLGTKFPLDETWIIEPISDSTLYPAYYIVSKYVNLGLIKEEDLDDEVFDYVFLGRGLPKKGLESVIESMRKEFLYWYPVDINLGGKEHMTVHFPVYIMNHVAILANEHWPRGIFVNWWVVQSKVSKEKLSKSKGGAEPAPKIGERYGIDAIRLYYCHEASPHDDMEWSFDKLENYSKRIRYIWNLFHRLLALDGSDIKFIDHWLISKINSRIKAVLSYLDKFDIRSAASEIFYGIVDDIEYYLKEGGNNKETARYVLERWVKLMAPITPHIAEEFWSLLGKETFVSLENYPEPEEEKISKYVEVGEEIIKRLVEDVKEIIRVTGIIPKKVYIYIAEDWKYDAFRALYRENFNVGSVIKEFIAKGYDKKLVPKVVQDLRRLAFDVPERLIESILEGFKEEKVLKEEIERIVQKIGAEIIVLSERDSKEEHKQKATRALPLKPAIVLE